MMNTCPVCGRTRLIPDERFWPYRYKEIYYCSENCWLCDITLTKMKEEKKEMARIKKDGTPAKRPGPKKKPAPAEAVHGMQETEDKFSDQCDMDLLKDEAPTVMVDGPLRIETKDALERLKLYADLEREYSLDQYSLFDAAPPAPPQD